MTSAAEMTREVKRKPSLLRKIFLTQLFGPTNRAERQLLRVLFVALGGLFLIFSGSCASKAMPVHPSITHQVEQWVEYKKCVRVVKAKPACYASVFHGR